MAYHYSKTGDKSFSEECCQLCFIKLWEFRHTLKQEIPFDRQLFQIAKTTLIDQIRKSVRERLRLQELRKNTVQTEAIPQYETDITSRITHALENLPPIRKKVFVLNRIQGLSYKEIGQELSISDRTVEKHISLALKQLRKILHLFF